MKNLFKSRLMVVVLTCLTAIQTPVFANPLQAEQVQVTVREAALDIVEDPTGTMTQAYHFPGLYQVGGLFSTAEEAETGGYYLMSNLFPALAMDWYSYEGTSGGFRCLTNGDAVARAKEVQLIANSWCKENLPGIVPNGKTLDEAVVLCANYLIKNAIYQTPDSSVPKQYRIGQTALPVLFNGQGVCSHFTAAFNTMISYIPFNRDGFVDWNADSPVYQQVMPIYHKAQNHVTSGLWQNGRWREIDVSSYDIAGNSKFLNM